MRRTPRARLPLIDCEAKAALVRVRSLPEKTTARVAHRGLFYVLAKVDSHSALKNNSGRDESVTARGLSPARAQSGSHCLRVRTITQRPHRLRA